MLQESSIHGLNFLGDRRLHFVERIIWMATVCLFGLTAFNIAIQSWYRYEYNATVLSLETSYRSWRYPLFGYTVCSNYTDEAAISAIVGKQWNVGKGNALYAYYVEFVRTIATTTYLSLHNYERYANDETLQNVDMLDMIRTVRRGYLDGLNRSEFSSIITEFGVCYTTGYFRNNLRNNPHFADDVMKSYRSAPKYAYSDVMELSISPYHLDIDANSTIFIHSKIDIIGADTSCKVFLQDDSMIEMTIEQKSIVGSQALHELPIRRRQCRYINESSLPYYPYYYTQNLCLITCRIQSAIKLCNCAPFFYYANERSCTPAGLYCLSKTDWYKPDCDCLPLCRYDRYVKSSINRYHHTMWTKLVDVSTRFPRTRWKRNVTFAFDGVMVAFGGTLSLFLGCSFISLAELVYFIALQLVRGCKKLRSHYESRKPLRKLQFKKGLVFRCASRKDANNQLPFIN